MDITLLGGEPRSTGAMTSKGAINFAANIIDTVSDGRVGMLAGADLSELDPSRNLNSSQRVLNFNVEDEYRLYQ